VKAESSPETGLTDRFRPGAKQLARA